MKCEKCNSENAENAVFCSNCGEKMEQNKVAEVVGNKAEDKKAEVIQEVIVTKGDEKNKNDNVDVPVFNSTASIVMIVVSILCSGGMIGAVFAILSLTEGLRVKDHVARGDMEQATQSLKESKKWLKVAYIISGVLFVAAIIITLCVFVIPMIIAGTTYNSYRYY